MVCPTEFALLFVVQPMMAKALLPRFGGSAGVWIACMLFFQAVLLLGYSYSFCLTRYLNGRAQALVHLGLLALSVGALPLKTRLEAAGGGPTITIVIVLTVSVGLPYFVLSTTSPLLQSWLAASRGEQFPYRLFRAFQRRFVVGAAGLPGSHRAVPSHASTDGLLVGWLCRTADTAGRRGSGQCSASTYGSLRGRPFLWIALAACASTLWLAIADYLGQQVGAMPFLWVVPMAIYLLSFILCFEADGWYRPSLFRWLMPVAWIAICSRIALQGSAGGLRWEIPILSAALFICCMFCHGELARSKPPAQKGLPFFYLVVAAGGALGGVFVGVIAPNLFTTFLELPLGVTASVFLALYLLFGVRSLPRLVRMGVVALLAFRSEHAVPRRTARSSHAQFLRHARNPRVRGGRCGGARAVQRPHDSRAGILSPALQRTPTTYYGVQSGAGRVLELSRSAGGVWRSWDWCRHVGHLRQGGDLFRFYEINPAVIRAATESFGFLRNSAAVTDVVTGDGRLMLDGEARHSFDIVVLDAFSDDAVPVHLLTRQAFEVYFDRLRPGGLLLIHLSNRYLDLAAEVEAIAAELHKEQRAYTATRIRHRGRSPPTGRLSPVTGTISRLSDLTRSRLRSGESAVDR
jgi:SAM-dependent methyltransferase